MKKILYGKDARDRLMKGVDTLANLVKSTMGPMGKNVILHRGYGNPTITKDGVTVAKEVEADDPIENIGVEIARVASQKTNEDVGDGTTTAAVLTQSILKHGSDLIEKDPALDVHAFRKRIDEGAKRIIDNLEKSKIDIDKDTGRLKHVATISANNDAETGALIAELFEKIGKDGAVTVEEHQGTGIMTERVEGFRFEKGYVSPYMITHEKGDISIVENAHILVTDRRITGQTELLPLMKKVSEAGRKDLVVICDELEGEALAFAVVNRVRPEVNFLTLAVRAPGFGDRKEQMLHDICTVTGAKLISVDAGDKIEDVEIEHLGTADRIEAGRDHCLIVGGKGDEKDIEVRKEKIRSDIEETKSPFEKGKLEERLAKLTGGVAVIRVGGKTEGEMREKKYLVEDAVNAVRAALQEGVIPGGGYGLLSAAKETGDEFFINVFGAPYFQILKNAHADIDSIIGQPYDAKHGKVVKDMFSAGIIDPFLVTRRAIENAVSAACLILTTDGLMAEVKKEVDKSDK